MTAFRKQGSEAVSDLESWRLKYQDQISHEAAKLTDEEINRMVHEIREEIAREAQENAS